MSQVVRCVLASLVGTVAGYLCLTVVANLENWQFYTVRSLITGRSAVSEIVAHPADRWVATAIFAVFIFGGAAAGILVARRFRPKAAGGPASPA